MAHVRLASERIVDWVSFHAECQRALGFPAFYGANMNAWIDCLSDRYADDGMCAVVLAPGETLILEVPDAAGLRARVPEIGTALVECTAFVNRRYIEAGVPPALELRLS